MTESLRILSDFFKGKANSSLKWEIFSKPTKAHGEIKAILMICSTALLSGINSGLKLKEDPLKPKITAIKTTLMPMVKINDITISIFIISRLLLLNNKVVMIMAMIANKASPK